MGLKLMRGQEPPPLSEDDRKRGKAGPADEKRITVDGVRATGFPYPGGYPDAIIRRIPSRHPEIDFS